MGIENKKFFSLILLLAAINETNFFYLLPARRRKKEKRSNYFIREVEISFIKFQERYARFTVIKISLNIFKGYNFDITRTPISRDEIIREEKKERTL